MLKFFQNLIQGTALVTTPKKSQSKDDSLLALIAVLVRLARTDGVYSWQERQHIETLLQVRFSCTDDSERQYLMKEGEALEANASDSVQLTRVLKAAYPLQERFELVKFMWQIVLIDRERHAEEDATMRLIGALLGLSDQEIAQARHAISKP